MTDSPATVTGDLKIVLSVLSVTVRLAGCVDASHCDSDLDMTEKF